MRLHPNGANPWATAAVGNAEGFVQVEVADIRAKVRRTAETHLGVHVGPIHVDLAAMGVNNLANSGNFRLKDAVGGGVGHHQRR